MKRRQFLKQAGVVGAVGGLAACSAQECAESPQGQGSGEPKREWKMVTAWPRNFPGLGTAANEVADAVTRMSAGRLTVKVYGANDLVPAFEVFDTVSSGTAEMGHAAPYYWKGKVPAAQFFAGVPFGLTAPEMNGWLYFGGGLDLWKRLYEPFNLVPFAAGNTAVQMGGWFNKEINSVKDLQGLKMRIPGLGGEVLERAGGVPVNLPGAELFTALESGAIDATEWVGPYNDLAFGLFRAASYYYYPGWHEPGTTLETMVNKEAFDALPEDLKAIVDAACHRANDRLMAEYTARNADALHTLTEEHGVELRRFPADVLDRLREISEEVVREAAGADPLAQEIFDSYVKFRDRSRSWLATSEATYYRAVGMGGD
ncbi:MAG: TRAP transporter substrate-binding protein DctP [Xanthomonadales bacterium]|nr:TRAP transporter substrate-binding protein DctP [Xanthomonadales bacterium]